jgi:hypothetical protein
VEPVVAATVVPARERPVSTASRPATHRPHLSYSALPNDPEEVQAAAKAAPSHRPVAVEVQAQRSEPDVLTLAASGAEAAAMARGKTASQRLYVAPRPPDDPGPDPTPETDEEPQRRATP